MALIDGDLTYNGNGCCNLCDKPFHLSGSGITYNNFLACSRCLPAFLRAFIKDYKKLRGWEWAFTPTRRTIEVAEDLEELAEAWRYWHGIYSEIAAYSDELSAVPNTTSDTQSPDSEG
jgi:hypothetical protein